MPPTRGPLTLLEDKKLTEGAISDGAKMHDFDKNISGQPGGAGGAAAPPIRIKRVY